MVILLIYLRLLHKLRINMNIKARVNYFWLVILKFNNRFESDVWDLRVIRFNMSCSCMLFSLVLYMKSFRIDYSS